MVADRVKDDVHEQAEKRLQFLEAKKPDPASLYYSKGLIALFLMLNELAS